MGFNSGFKGLICYLLLPKSRNKRQILVCNDNICSRFGGSHGDEEQKEIGWRRSPYVHLKRRQSSTRPLYS